MWKFVIKRVYYSIIRNKGINGSPVYNIGKRGQEMLKTVYGI